MDLVQTVRKSGSRGGVNFSWDEVANSQHRENYLGHSLKAPVGRWAKGRDLNWYAKADDSPANANETDAERESRERKEELRRVKEAEEDAMCRALGKPVPVRDSSGANAIEVGTNRRIGAVATPAETKEEEADQKEQRHGERSRRHRDPERRHGRRDRSRSPRRLDAGARRSGHRHRHRERSRDGRDDDRERRRRRSRSRSRDRRGDRREREREHGRRDRGSRDNDRERRRSTSGERRRIDQSPPRRERT